MKDEHTPRFEAPRGISRRDYFALHIFCAFILKGGGGTTTLAIEKADLLLEELDGPGPDVEREPEEAGDDEAEYWRNKGRPGI
jgi:hypothetical protein